MSGADLHGRVALVTGAGRGIGKVIVEHLAAAGATLALTARSEDQLLATAAAIEEQQGGRRPLVVPGDVTDPGAVAEVVSRTRQELGPIDLLINNAGVQEQPGPLWEADVDAWWRTFEVHVRGTFLYCRAVIPQMIERGGGRIINVASRAGIVSRAHNSAYFASKCTQVRLTELLAAEVRSHGICVFAIHPGGVRTVMNEQSLDSDAGRKWFPGAMERLRGSAVPAARLCVELAAGHGDVFSGRYIDVDTGLAKLTGSVNEVLAKNLYTLRLRTLPGDHG